MISYEGKSCTFLFVDVDWIWSGELVNDIWVIVEDAFGCRVLVVFSDVVNQDDGF